MLRGHSFGTSWGIILGCGLLCVSGAGAASAQDLWIGTLRPVAEPYPAPVPDLVPFPYVAPLPDCDSPPCGRPPPASLVIQILNAGTTAHVRPGPVLVEEVCWAGEREAANRLGGRRRPGILTELDPGRYEFQPASTIAHTADAVPSTPPLFERGLVPLWKTIAIEVPHPGEPGLRELVVRVRDVPGGSVGDHRAPLLLPMEPGGSLRSTIYAPAGDPREFDRQVGELDAGAPVLLPRLASGEIRPVREFRIELHVPPFSPPPADTGSPAPGNDR